MISVSVIVATYGDQKWERLAQRALRSADGQHAHEIIGLHLRDGSLAQTRNEAAAGATGDWLCFVDGDDQLAPGYIAAMDDALDEHWREQTAAGQLSAREAVRIDVPLLLITPSVAYGRGNDRWHQRQLLRLAAERRGVQTLVDGNWLVIGTLVPRQSFEQVGGFDDRFPIFEDWHLFARIWEAGAQLVEVPDAVYLATITRSSRNRASTRAQQLYWHQMIGHDIFPRVYLPTTADENARRILLTANVRREPQPVR